MLHLPTAAAVVASDFVCILALQMLLQFRENHEEKEEEKTQQDLSLDLFD